jgi:hypothetical protein
MLDDGSAAADPVTPSDAAAVETGDAPAEPADGTAGPAEHPVNRTVATSKLAIHVAILPGLVIWSLLLQTARELGWIRA